MARKVKKMPLTTFIIALSLAVVFDVLNAIPFVPFGIIFTFMGVIIFKIEGYSGKFISFKSSRQAAITVLRVIRILSIFIEAVPVINILPGCVMFVVISYFANRGSFKAQKKSEKEQANAQINMYAEEARQLQRYQERYQGGLIP